MTISQQQLVDYLIKKIGYGVAKTDTAAAKSPSNESISSPLLSVAASIWQASGSIPATIPNSNTSVVTLYNDALSTAVQCVVDPTTATANETWKTNLIDWVPPLFGASYQVKLYAAPANTPNPQTVGTQLFPDGSGNNDGWFFDYQAGIVNFADTSIPAAVAGNVVYVVGARYTGGKGISNFPQGITANSISANSFTYSNGVSILSSVGGTYSNANVAAYLTSSSPITVVSGIPSIGANTGAFQVYGGASIGGNLYIGGNLLLQGNSYTVTTPLLAANVVTASAYFWANGVPFNYGNVQVAAYLAAYTGSIANSSNIIALYADFNNISNQIIGANARIQTIDANLGTNTTRLNTLSANVGAYEAWANATFITGTTGSISTLSANLGAFEIYSNANIGAIATNVSTIQGNITALNLNSLIATNNINILLANAGVQQTQINTLATGANANVAAYLLQNPTGSITIGGSAQTTTANTGAFQVYGGASIGANLYVGGNLIVQGNTYTLNTEIITQNELVASSIYAGGYFFSNGAAFSVYGNTQVAQYLSTYNGNILADGLVANTVQIKGSLFVTNIVTAGQSGNISNVNYIFGNTFAFTANGMNILSAINPYGNANVAGYLPSYSGNVGANYVTSTYANASIVTATNFVYANGMSILNSVGGTYSNANVTAYLPINSANVSAGNIFPTGNVVSTGQIVQFVNGTRGSGLLAGNLTPVVNNPYVFSSSYALSTTGPTAQNTAGNVALQLGGGAFTVQFWLYLSSNPSSNPIVFGKDQTGGTEYYATVTTTGIYFSTTSGLQTGGNYTFTPVVGVWYHITWSCDGTTYRIFANGQLVATAPVAGGAITNSTSPLTVGASARGVNYFYGQLEDFRIDKGVAITQNFPVPANYTGSNNNTVFYLRSWTGASGLTTTTDQTAGTGYFNLKMINSTSPSPTTTAGPFTYGTAGQSLAYDGSTSWYSTGGFQVQGNTAAYNTVTGALQVVGGAGIQGNLYSGNIGTTGLYAAVATVGTLYVTGNETDYGNVTSGNLLTNGIYFANGAAYNFGTTYSNANVAAYLLTNSGNISAPYVLTNGLYYANGQPYNFGTTYSNANVQSYLANFGSNVIVTTGNIASGNVLTGGLYYANGQPYSFGSTYSNANVQSYLANFGSNIITTSGNIQSGNVITGAITASSLTVSNETVTGNVTASNILTNNHLYANGVNILSGLTSYGNANVTAYLTSPLTSTGNIYAGNVIASSNVYANYLFGNLYSVGTDIISGNIQTIGSGGNITGANVISANAFTYANGINILTGVVSVYGNSNVAGYLNNGTGPITIASGAQATGANTGVLQVWGGASIGANLYVGGNLIISGNTYELQTEIITQSEVVATNLYAGAYFWANGVPFVSSNYSNANVAAYLASNTDATISNLNANAAIQATSLNSLNANIGSYQLSTTTALGTTTANLGYASANINLINANLGAFEIYANANLGTTTNNITTLFGNAATQVTQINTLNANVGAFDRYANVQFAGIAGEITTLFGSVYTNSDVAAYLPSYSGTIGGDITIGGNLTVTGNTNLVYTTVTQETITTTEVVAGNLVANSGTTSTSTTTGALVIVGGAGISGNVFAGNVYSPNYYYANGKPFVSSIYGDSNVSAFLGVTAGNLLANTSLYQNLSHTSANRTYYLSFYDKLLGNASAYADSNLSFNPNNGTLTATTFSGAGVFSTITASGTSILAGNVVLTSDTPSTSTTTGALVITGLGGLGVASNVTVGGSVVSNSYVYANGQSIMTGVGSVYGNANVQSYLANFGSNSVITTGNVIASNVVATGNLVTTNGIFWANGTAFITTPGIQDQSLTTDGVTKVFTLNQITDTKSVLITVNGVVQLPTYAYTVSGTQLTFNEAPLSTDLVDVRFLAGAMVNVSSYNDSNVAVYLGNNTGNVGAGNVTATGLTTTKGIINTNPPIISGATTLSTAFLGGLLELGGAAPYTVTLPNPTKYTGAMIAIWQNTSQNITLSTPVGNFYGPNGSSTSTIVLAQATTQYWHLWADGYNWAVFAIKTV